MEYLRESHLGDLIKVVQAVAGIVKTTKENPDDSLVKIVRGATNRDKQYVRSLTSQASKLVMTFPVLASNTLEPNTAIMISKAVERKCVLMIQMLFAADLKVELANQGGIQNVINQYYNGIDFSNLSVDDMIKVVETISPATYEKYFKETYTAEICALSIKAIIEKCYEDDISDLSLAEYYMSEDNHVRHDSTMVVQEAKKAPNFWKKHGLSGEDMADQVDFSNIIGDWDMATLINLDKNDRDRYYKEWERRYQSQQMKTQKEKNEFEKAKFLYQKGKDEFNKQLDLMKNSRDEKIAAAQLKNMEAQLKSARGEFFKRQLMDSDIKKANELVPSMLIVNYAIDGGHDKELLQTSSIIGVKTRLIPLDSFEILQKLVAKNKDKSGLVKFIRATTGEIKFMKDFILAVDKAKVDALTKSKKGSVNPIWKVLERRSAVSDLRKALGQKNDASPITTLVITQEEVDFLKKESNMNMDDVNTANFIIHAYNLMGLVIVDESTETAKFLFDGEFDTFDTLPFGTLERENGDASMYKKVINLMSKRM